MPKPSQELLDTFVSLPGQRVSEEDADLLAAALPSRMDAHRPPKEADVEVTEDELVRMLIDLANGVTPKAPTEAHKLLRDKLTAEIAAIRKAGGGVHLSPALPDAES